MIYYILHQDNLELVELTLNEFIEYLIKTTEIVISFDPKTQEILSNQPIRQYWFHIFGNRLDESVHLSQETSERFFTYISDHNSNGALRNYVHSFNNGKFHVLADYEDYAMSYPVNDYAENRSY